MIEDYFLADDTELCPEDQQRLKDNVSVPTGVPVTEKRLRALPATDASTTPVWHQNDPHRGLHCTPSAIGCRGWEGGYNLMKVS